MNKAMKQAIDSAPAGTTGFVCEPWTPGEVYGVAADWAQAAGSVYSYGEDGWNSTGHQVADYLHSDRSALVANLAEALQMSGESEEDAKEEAESLAVDATKFDAGNASEDD